MEFELNKIYNMDCLEGMKAIPDNSVDCIICDLPYEVLNKGNKDAQWDRVIPFEPLWEQYLRVAKEDAPIILFGQGMFTAQLMMSQPSLWRYNLIWDKGLATGFLNANRMPLRVHEDIAVFYRSLPTYNPQKRKGTPNHTRGRLEGKTANRCYGTQDQSVLKDDFSGMKFPTSIIDATKECDADRFHPTQKPVALIEYLVKTYTNEGDTVLDNCMGSGTTAVACLRTKRNYIGFELSKEYYDKAEERIAHEKVNQSFEQF